MISNEDYSINGKCLHRNTRGKGSVVTVRVGSRSLPLYPLVITCLGLLNAVLLLAAIVIGANCGNNSNEESVSHELIEEALIEVMHFHTIKSEAITALTDSRQALMETRSGHRKLQLLLKKNKTLCDDTQRKIETVQVEKATLLSSIAHIKLNCRRCLPGWLFLNSSCYFHSASASSQLKNWTDSRADCISHGADLAVINDWTEQLNLCDALPKSAGETQRQLKRFGGTWIGLTYVQTESTWVWVNNMTEVDQGYWMYREPNNTGQQGNDCVANLNIMEPRKTWFVASCQDRKQWLCEMPAN